MVIYDYSYIILKKHIKNQIYKKQAKGGLQSESKNIFSSSFLHFYDKWNCGTNR